MKHIEKIYDLETGDITFTEREFTTHEIANIEAAEIALIAEREERQAKAAAKAALLERLGITEEEAKLLLG